MALRVPPSEADGKRGERRKRMGRIVEGEFGRGSSRKPSDRDLLPLLLLLLLLPATPCHAFKIPVLFDSTNHWHRDAQYHPEQSARIEKCVRLLERTKLDQVELFDVAPANANNVPSLSDAAKLWKFTEQELSHARDMLVRAHSEDLVATLEQRCRNSRQQRIDDGKEPLGFIGYIDADTFLTTESYDVCLRATAAWIRAVDLALSGETRSAFALTRPPGHHATPSLSNGFCLVNFAAAAAIHALETNPAVRKVSVLDWDVHYGQGVAKILEKHHGARYVSIHQSPAFPYLGNRKQITGDHRNILTLPIPADSTWTCGYRSKLTEDALPFLKTKGVWEPDLVIVCAGYDALSSDELASVNLNAVDYGVMIEQLVRHLDGKDDSNTNAPTSIMLGLEGGYQLKDMKGTGNLADAVGETVQSLHRLRRNAMARTSP